MPVFRHCTLAACAIHESEIKHVVQVSDYIVNPVAGLVEAKYRPVQRRAAVLIESSDKIIVEGGLSGGLEQLDRGERPAAAVGERITPIGIGIVSARIRTVLQREAGLDHVRIRLQP